MAETPLNPLENQVISVGPAANENLPTGTARTSFSVDVSDASVSLDPADLKVKAASPKDYAVNKISILSSMGSGTLQLTYDFARNAATSIAGEDAWRLDYITNIGGRQAIFSTEIFVVRDNKVYDIKFNTQPLLVPEMMPVDEKIIQSFRFI